MPALFRLILVALSGLVLANCATVTRGLTNQVQITSEPVGADVRTSLSHACTTPCTLQIDRKAEFTVSYSKAGYKDATVNVKTQIAGAGAAGFAGNLIIGGVVGMGVDVATGSTLEHVPNPVHAKLELEKPLRKQPVARSRLKKPAPPAPAPEPEAQPDQQPSPEPVAPAS